MKISFRRSGWSKANPNPNANTDETKRTSHGNEKKNPSCRRIGRLGVLRPRSRPQRKVEEVNAPAVSYVSDIGKVKHLDRLEKHGREELTEIEGVYSPKKVDGFITFRNEEDKTGSVRHSNMPPSKPPALLQSNGIIAQPDPVNKKSKSLPFHLKQHSSTGRNSTAVSSEVQRISATGEALQVQQNNNSNIESSMKEDNKGNNAKTSTTKSIEVEETSVTSEEQKVVMYAGGFEVRNPSIATDYCMGVGLVDVPSLMSIAVDEFEVSVDPVKTFSSVVVQKLLSCGDTSNTMDTSDNYTKNETELTNTMMDVLERLAVCRKDDYDDQTFITGATSCTTDRSESCTTNESASKISLAGMSFDSYVSLISDGSISHDIADDDDSRSETVASEVDEFEIAVDPVKTFSSVVVQKIGSIAASKLKCITDTTKSFKFAAKRLAANVSIASEEQKVVMYAGGFEVRNPSIATDYCMGVGLVDVPSLMSIAVDEFEVSVDPVKTFSSVVVQKLLPCGDSTSNTMDTSDNYTKNETELTNTMMDVLERLAVCGEDDYDDQTFMTGATSYTTDASESCTTNESASSDSYVSLISDGSISRDVADNEDRSETVASERDEIGEIAKDLADICVEVTGVEIVYNPKKVDGSITTCNQEDKAGSLRPHSNLPRPKSFPLLQTNEFLTLIKPYQAKKSKSLPFHITRGSSTSSNISAPNESSIMQIPHGNTNESIESSVQTEYLNDVRKSATCYSADASDSSL